MRKSRITGIVVGLLVLTIAVSGAAFAWFAGAVDGLGGTGDAAKLKLTKGENVTTVIEFDKVLPGQAVSFADGSEINFLADRGGFVEFSITAFDTNSGLKIRLKPTAELTAEEIIEIDAKPLDYSKDATGYYMTPKRVKEIMEIQVGATGPISGLKALYTDGSTQELVFKTDTGSGKVYTYVPERQDAAGKYMDAEVNFATEDALKVHFLGEFGGNFVGASGSASADRQYEQEATFEEGIGLVVKGIQPTKEAVRDYLGAGAEAFIAAQMAAGQFGVGSTPDSWTYVG